MSDTACGAAIGAVNGYSSSDITSDMLCAGGEAGKDGCQVQGRLNIFVQTKNIFCTSG